ncbi:3-oxoacyl-ACP reductase [Anaerobacillus arseniciselenatis]|uniref:3-oxoacyl-ACP reductase n=1 Tax=Anaerobacillus arseniciselenatis TaxID=85682 RepID=A0A1S2L795_9BACI|nr:SDR family oxidoreductase [Anaerobacillus arseniciselenatis]OIJ08216.1 3-oxoacyl-ACP reductase [Anaerobacillus arseniciselenatis]
MDLGLKNKAVLVLASSKGLGKATALEYVSHGASVMISSRNENELVITAKQIKQLTGQEVVYCVADVSSYHDIKNLVTKTVEQFGTIDVLINNAGGPPAGGFDDFNDDDWQKSFELNLLSVIRTIREVLPYMKKQGSGRIVNIASSSIKQPIDHLILSNTFRTGMVGLAKTLSSELAKDNILINTIGPGQIKTDRIGEFDKAKAESLGITQEEVQRTKENQIPLGRYGTPGEFAKVMVFFGSYANTYVTGQSLLVEGGMVKSL